MSAVANRTLTAPKCERCGAAKVLQAVGEDETDDGPLKWARWHPCSCQVLNPPTLADLVRLAVCAADKGEEVPEWREAAKWAEALRAGGDAALAFVRWLDEDQGIVLANMGPGVCPECVFAGPPDGEEGKHDHPPAVIPLDGPSNGPEILLAMMLGVDLGAVDDQRRALAQWRNGRQPPRAR